MSAVAELRSRAMTKRGKALHWEALFLEQTADRIERSPYPVPQTIIILSDLYLQALADIEREREFMGSSFDEAVTRGAALRGALEELGAM